MADLTTDCAGIKSPNPFWVASGPPANTAYQVMRAFDAGWGGAVWKTAQIEEVEGVAHKHGLSVHMDGARLLNAEVSASVPAKAMTAPCDTVWVDLSKGLGCPVGGVLNSTGSSASRNRLKLTTSASRMAKLNRCA